MPPVNSPNNTRPSTPPLQSNQLEQTDALTRSPYLQQLEQAISTPVPDLASTLNLTATAESTLVDAIQAEIYIPTRAANDSAPVSNSHLSRYNNRRNDNALERIGDDSFASRPYLTESEFQRWPSESRRRVMSQSQLSRLQESNMANEENIHTYSTTGDGPARQSLYDWAATRRENGNEEDGEVVTRDEPSIEVDQIARRDLERALRNYRSARNALRSTRGSGFEIASVPTASALRSFWSEESIQNDTTNHPLLNETAEEPEQLQYRIRRMQRARLEEERERRMNSSLPSIRTISRERRTSEAFMKVRNLIRYLSDLRTTDFHNSLNLARNLGLDSLYECKDANTPSDLPMTIDVLPRPKYSSWLEPGMIWQGLQSTDKEQSHSSITASTLRREMQREYLRRAMVRRGMGGDTDTSSRLVDAERYLSDLLQDRNGRWGHHSSQELRQSSISNIPTSSRLTSSDGDHWPVTVTIHSVNFAEMTLTGTMAAKHIPDKFTPNYPDHNPEGNSTESFFQGEIIDFRRHTLESEGQNGYSVGGVEIDAQYWQRIGPFKEAVSQTLQSNLNINSSTKLQSSNTIKSWRDNVEMNHIESINATDSKMAQCLGNTTWLSEKLGEEWILMRWKEKCFVNTTESSNSNSTLSSRVYTTSSPENTAWGLTISGFYYVALNRWTGDIDGLYYDPGSQPYQQLKMNPIDGSSSNIKGVKSTFPSVEFR